MKTHRFKSMYKTEWVECDEDTAKTFTGNPCYRVEKLPEIDMCESCHSKEAKSPHTCPYTEEINHSYIECNCCDNCITNCCMEI